MRGLALIVSLLLGSTGLAQAQTRCELAPAWGRGQSTLGQIDQITQLTAECSYGFAISPELTLGPRVQFSDQQWAIERQASGPAELYSLQARTWQLGFILQHAWGSWSSFYGVSQGSGQGQLERTLSTANSRQSATYRGMQQSLQQHEIGVRFASQSRWSYGLSLQRTLGRQAWSPDQAQFLTETVDSQNRLTLTSGSLNLAAPSSTSSQSVSTELRLSVQLRFD
jgi:hypothetical protein